jgi:hypothetical protein
MMSHGGIRHHAIGASIVDQNITLQYYGHSTILYSEPLNFVADFPKFLSVLLQLMSLGHREWGFAKLVPKVPKVILEKRRPILSLYKGQSLQVGERSFVLGDILNQQHGIIGRGTCVIGAKSDQDEAVVKFSWREPARTPENEFIERALKHLPSTGEDDNSLKHHLPNILGHNTDDHWIELGDECEPRYLQIMVFTKLTPITALTNADDLAEAYRGIFKCSCSLVVSLERN